ncbi:MAG: 30S ribosomal protein S10 [Alphaproteobacteria bacterium]|nr:30S ribosomal protein S10 [Alphaproteobacteria bacterium]
MITKKIRIYLKSFNHKIIEQACNLIKISLNSKKSLNKICGPVSFPTKKKIYCVLRSPHVDKDSREHFEIRQYKKLIDIHTDSSEIFDILFFLNFPAGVSVNFFKD